MIRRQRFCFISAVMLLGGIVLTQGVPAGQNARAPRRSFNVNAKGNNGLVKGTISFHNTPRPNKVTTSWNLALRDTKPNDRGVYIRLWFDLPAAQDDWRQSPGTSGGKVRQYSGTFKDWNTRSVRIEVCEGRGVLPDKCSTVATVRNR
jgi:hypothetical protein